MKAGIPFFFSSDWGRRVAFGVGIGLAQFSFFGCHHGPYFFMVANDMACGIDPTRQPCYHYFLVSIRDICRISHDLHLPRARPKFRAECPSHHRISSPSSSGQGLLGAAAGVRVEERKIPWSNVSLARVRRVRVHAQLLGLNEVRARLGRGVRHGHRGRDVE